MFPWIAALLLGALAPALIVAGVSTSIRILPIALGITLGHSIIMGLPVALFYRARQWKRVSAAVLGAALIGVIPIGFLAWPMRPGSKTSASVDGVATIIDGIPTLAGWLGYLKLLGMFGGLGAAGGLVFWLTLKWCGALTVTDPVSVKPVLRQRRIGVLLAGAAMAASAAVFALPTITADRSCHNMFRDGRRSASTMVNIDLDITNSDWPRLAQLLERFAESHGMSFRNTSETKPAVVEILGLSACTEDGAVISVIEQRWNTQSHAALMRDRGVAVGVYDLHSGTGWQPFAKDLVAALESEWPGKVGFRDSGGRLVPGPVELMPQAHSTPGRQ